MHIGCTAREKRYDRVERFSCSWMVLLLLQILGHAAHHAEWHYTHVVLMSMMAIPTIAATMASVDVIISDIGIWISFAVSFSEFAVI